MLVQLAPGPSQWVWQIEQEVAKAEKRRSQSFLRHHLSQAQNQFPCEKQERSGSKALHVSVPIAPANTVVLAAIPMSVRMTDVVVRKALAEITDTAQLDVSFSIAVPTGLEDSGRLQLRGETPRASRQSSTFKLPSGF